VAAVRERTSDGIFINKFGGNGNTKNIHLEEKFGKALDELLETVRKTLSHQD